MLRSSSSSFLTACFKCLLGTTIKKKTIFIQEITSFLCDWDTTPAFARLLLYHLPKLCYNMFAIKKKTLAHVMAYQSHKSVRGVPFRSTLFVYSNTTKENQKSNLAKLSLSCFSRCAVIYFVCLLCVFCVFISIIMCLDTIKCKTKTLI